MVKFDKMMVTRALEMKKCWVEGCSKVSVLESARVSFAEIRGDKCKSRKGG